MNRIRSIRQTAELLKSEDRDTAITESAIRRLVKEEVIPFKRIGKKYLLDVDVVIDYFKEAV